MGAIGLNNSGAILTLGDYTGNVFDYTHVTINTDTSLIKTSSGGADKGLFLDFANEIYKLELAGLGLYLDLQIITIN